MYTEDDEKVKVVNDDSSNDEGDFYTSFNEIDENDDHKKVKKKTPPKKKEKEEEDYSDFYNSNDEEENNDSSDKGNKIKIALFALLILLVLAVVLIIIFVPKNKKDKGDIKLAKTSYSLKVGESDYISYEIIDTESDVVSTFSSSDTNVIMIDNNGQMTAIGIGEAVITINYSIDGNKHKKTCKVVVSGGEDVNQDITLSLKLSSKANEWTNKDVKITIEANSVFGISNIKYGLNCDSDCKYVNMNGDTLTISSNGITKVKVVATDKKKQESTKEVTVKIDKEAPKATYNGQKTITATGSVEVCATCSDEISGCKQNKVCKKFTGSKSNQSITVYDKAGNKKSSTTFNVQIKAAKQPCTLKVSSDGVVTATVHTDADYYGFSDKYSGNNELSKKVEISASKKGESGAKVVSYYVKNKNGNGGKCVITVIKECACTDSSSTAANCPVTCKFRSM